LTREVDDASSTLDPTKQTPGVEHKQRTNRFYSEIEALSIEIEKGDKVHSGKVPFYKACQLTKLRVCLTYKVRCRAVALAVTASSREVSSKPIAKT
jgi:hypothetical protein